MSTPPAERFWLYSIVRKASNGGNGSFSYLDTSIYGPRQLRANGVAAERRDWSATEPVLLGVRRRSHLVPVSPGAGGGAKINSRHFGSYATAANPSGLVVVRLRKFS